MDRGVVVDDDGAGAADVVATAAAAAAQPAPARRSMAQIPRVALNSIELGHSSDDDTDSAGDDDGGDVDYGSGGSCDDADAFMEGSSGGGGGDAMCEKCSCCTEAKGADGAKEADAAIAADDSTCSSCGRRPRQQQQQPSRRRRRRRRVSKSTRKAMALTPSCVEDFTKEWVLFIMQKYFENNFDRESAAAKAASPAAAIKAAVLEDIGPFCAEKSGDWAIEASAPAAEDKSEEEALANAEEDDEDDGDSTPSSASPPSSSSTTAVTPRDGGKKPPHSHHILSQAYKVMVDVPDPPYGSPKIHHLFVKIPPMRTAKFERMVRRNRTLEHEVKVYSELLKDLQKFIKSRVGDAVQLKIPALYHGFEDGASDSHVLVIEDLHKKGYSTRDWFKHKLSHDEVMLAVNELATFHACGLAYRMSLKEEIDEKYPYLEDDLYTSNMAKELLAKYLDSFLHFLSLLPGIQEHVLKLRKISNEVFQLLVKLRRPSDPLGTRFNTVCHGDMWMGNLMFRNGAGEDGGKDQVQDCTIIDFHSAQFLSPATDLAHLLLTSTTRAYRQEHWDEVVQAYYNKFNRVLAEFGLILRHLGTTYNDFLYEVKRALRGQFLCVAFIIPIVIYCGPTEWRFERRRGSSVDRKNTVRHLIQMMAITEEKKRKQSSRGNKGLNPEAAAAGGGMGGDDEEDDDYAADGDDSAGIPSEFLDLYHDKELTQTLVDLIHTASDLDILDFQEFCKHIDTPKPMWSKTQATTGKHIPVY